MPLLAAGGLGHLAPLALRCTLSGGGEGGVRVVLLHTRIKLTTCCENTGRDQKRSTYCPQMSQICTRNSEHFNLRNLRESAKSADDSIHVVYFGLLNFVPMGEGILLPSPSAVLSGGRGAGGEGSGRRRAHPRRAPRNQLGAGRSHRHCFWFGHEALHLWQLKVLDISGVRRSQGRRGQACVFGFQSRERRSERISRDWHDMCYLLCIDVDIQ